MYMIDFGSNVVKFGNIFLAVHLLTDYRSGKRQRSSPSRSPFSRDQDAQSDVRALRYVKKDSTAPPAYRFAELAGSRNTLKVPRFYLGARKKTVGG